MKLAFIQLKFLCIFLCILSTILFVTLQRERKTAPGNPGRHSRSRSRSRSRLNFEKQVSHVHVAKFKEQMLFFSLIEEN